MPLGSCARLRPADQINLAKYWQTRRYVVLWDTLKHHTMNSHSSEDHPCCSRLRWASSTLCFALPQRASAGPGVARISDMQGSVAVQARRLQPSRSQRPSTRRFLRRRLVLQRVTIRALEVDLDGSSSVRLGAGGPDMRFSNLDPGSRRMQLAQGPVDLRVFSRDDLGTQIDTPSISVRPRGSPGAIASTSRPTGARG